jgi:Type I phosphodiesterase / nucleotide pyrophosphatase
VVLGRKLSTLLLLVGLLGLPAVLLRFMCVGQSCEEEARASKIPFCSLEQGLRSRIETGFREGRSPEVVAVPSGDYTAGTRVPIVFAGDGIGSSKIPGGTTLTSIAPTLAALIDFERPFPEVRSGESIEGIANGPGPRMLLVLILKGIDSDALEENPEAWPFLASLMNEGAATMDGDTGSLPLDPAAIISTIGTGGTPSQHGITGELVRNDDGRLVRAFSERADSPVIATLADDLDESLNQEPLIGLVGSARSDRGAIGGDWYIGGDRDMVVVASRDRVGATTKLLTRGFGGDEVPDLLSVVLEGGPGSLDRDLERIVGAANRAANGSVALAVTATGSLEPDPEVSGDEVAPRIDDAVGFPVVEAAVPGGLFLDQGALADEELSDDVVIDELQQLRGPDGRLFEDVFPGIAVSFARYC